MKGMRVFRTPEEVARYLNREILPEGWTAEPAPLHDNGCGLYEPGVALLNAKEGRRERFYWYGGGISLYGAVRSTVTLIEELSSRQYFD